jgi:hypothetical protein
VVKSLALAALVASSMPNVNASIQTTLAPMQEQPVVLMAIIEVGTTSLCGLRDAPHLIEHLLLSDTRYGANPVDAVVSLRAQGIKLTAMTHSDFTEYTLEGPASMASTMGDALVTFLSRASIPKSGFEREKKAILNEIRAPDSYVSEPTFYEQFIAYWANGDLLCSSDPIPFLAYDYDSVQEAYDLLYTQDRIKLVGQAATGTFDLDAIAAKLTRPDTSTYTLNPKDGNRGKPKRITPIGRPGLVEVIYPIAGRDKLSADAAQELADQARFAVQAHIRNTYQLYTARTFVDQSLHGGWLRLEVPGLDKAATGEVMTVAGQGMDQVIVDRFSADPIWRAFGEGRTDIPLLLGVVAELQESSRGWLAKFMDQLRELIRSI